MSSGQNITGFVQEVADNWAYSFALAAGLALLTYDTILTLPLEIEVIWRKKIRLIAVFYSMARYSEIIFFIFEFSVQKLPPKFHQTLDLIVIQTCKPYINYVVIVLNFFPLIGVQALLVARTYAISGQNRWVLAVLSILFLGTIIPVILLSVITTCTPSISQRRVINLYNNIGGYFAIALDTVVIAVTIYQTLGIVKFSSREFSVKGSLTSHILKQGVLRYIFVLTVSVTSIVCQATLRPTIAPILNPVQDSLSIIIICRFLLDIRQRNQHTNGTTQSIPSVGTFRAASHHVRDIVVEEFGDPTISDLSMTESRAHETGTNTPAHVYENGDRDAESAVA